MRCDAYWAVGNLEKRCRWNSELHSSGLVCFGCGYSCVSFGFSFFSTVFCFSAFRKVSTQRRCRDIGSIESAFLSTSSTSNTVYLNAMRSEILFIVRSKNLLLRLCFFFARLPRSRFFRPRFLDLMCGRICKWCPFLLRYCSTCMVSVYQDLRSKPLIRFVFYLPRVFLLRLL